MILRKILPLFLLAALTLAFGLTAQAQTDCTNVAAWNGNYGRSAALFHAALGEPAADQDQRPPDLVAGSVEASSSRGIGRSSKHISSASVKAVVHVPLTKYAAISVVLGLQSPVSKYPPLRNGQTTVSNAPRSFY